MRRWAARWLAAALLSGALGAGWGCGGSGHAVSGDRTIPRGASGLLGGGRGPASTQVTRPRASAPTAASRQSVLERLARACAEKRKVAPNLSASRNQAICRQLKLMP